MPTTEHREPFERKGLSLHKMCWLETQGKENRTKPRAMLFGVQTARNPPAQQTYENRETETSSYPYVLFAFVLNFKCFIFQFNSIDFKKHFLSNY